jgi:DNA-binding IclR family transcriptional regulator
MVRGDRDCPENAAARVLKTLVERGYLAIDRHTS